MQESEDPIQIARENGAEMTEPETASISRERKVARTSGKFKASRVSNQMTKTSVQDRIKEYPDNHFACVKEQLQCDACHEIITVKKSTVQKRAVPKTIKWHHQY